MLLTQIPPGENEKQLHLANAGRHAGGGEGKESEKRKREVDNNIWRMKNRWKESVREIHEKKKRYIQ